MNKREFLAMGGAVPLMLAGCGSGTGSAPMRLVNASVGYPNGLGFMIQSTEATTQDVPYGQVSPFVNVQAGAVEITLTVGTPPASATAAQTRTLNKDSRYSLIAYGLLDELKFVPITESTVVPDAGQANINVLNTSVDVGPVDIYLSATKDLSVSTLIAAGVGGGSQSAFAGVLAGSYFVTVVGANSIAQGISDVRFQSPAAITLTALEIVTVILTPGVGGVLANAIILTQGTATQATQPVNDLNTTARIRAITSTGGLSTQVVGTSATTGNPVTILASNTTSQYSNYFDVNTGTPPVVTVNGATVVPFMYPIDPTTGLASTTPVTATLSAGGDYTLMVYVNGSGAPIAQVILDNNTAPVTAQGVKFRLVNLAYNNQDLQLSMSVNSINVASLIGYGSVSAYTEIATPQATNSVAEVFNGTDVLATHTQVMPLGNIFTDFVLSVDPSTGVAKDIFRGASGT
jgi:hypothetical protein